MSKENYLRDNYLWWAVKFISLFVQLSATWHVYTVEFIHRPVVERYFITLCAALVIDVLFIAASYFIESSEVRTLDKIPFLIVNILLASS